MKKNNLDLFHSVSIAGRYIYGYFCLMSVLKVLKLKPLFKPLDDVLKEFVETDRLDDWQEKVERFLPSKISKSLSKAGVVVDIGFSYELAIYYSEQPKIVSTIVEELIWLGMSNLYGRFDSNITFDYIRDIVMLLESNNIDLPDMSFLSNYPVSKRGGWGDSQSFPNMEE